MPPSPRGPVVQQSPPALTDCAECRAACVDDHLRSLMDPISRGDRDAFVTLFDHTRAAVRATIDEELQDPQCAAAVFAATYVEVWWLAGCHIGSGTDVVGWINRIAERRSAEEQPCPASASSAPEPAIGDAVDAQHLRALLELTSLLGRPLEPLTKLDLGRC
ncbi:hypothetical protein Acy02nite_71850 [Actinoplanes cyaneus]|uniref:Uncharacterized protein n=1 Tax=Actinoplanes cyaneus TaxID=52696 RepID=A0A919MB67_9ACTN|nr:hypothetical protein Acy02nite_71850 [Actinoplanes cyaneus]